ncbi:hypothetical protein Poli38472_013031 [Pythium oligandrum]|uniref:Uncharacterized protein n=1 Tax=Pythium oligandrum TaxID=41045 RepID=A0A8K1FKP4_PYTOL|nr:hypothetical protein Poli38472_013031 [Pythium oligandrum]|eukprot:TMW64409.1 hypothetical protein Poli38472_013031 [Pythium oligandrum]
MASSNGHARRFTSFATQVDAAIERVVTHFEENDLALRMDVLRALSLHAKLAFETERVKERLTQHPATKELIDAVTTQSTLYERLHKGLVVEAYSCDYDKQQNVEMSATVRWDLTDASVANVKKTGKKTHKRRRVSGSFWATYAFSRELNEENETVVTYTLGVSLGETDQVQELVRFELESETHYPRNFYEEDHGDLSDDEEGGEKDGEESDEEPSAEPVPSESGDDDQDGEEDERLDKAEGEEDEEEKDAFGQRIRSFEFNDAVLDSLLEWLHADVEELDPSDLMSFFLALPFYEDDWTIDERICQILFGGPSEFEGESEIVSDEELEEEDDEE